MKRGLDDLGQGFSSNSRVQLLALAKISNDAGIAGREPITDPLAWPHMMA